MNFIHMFNLIDTDNSGEITKEELVAFMKLNNFAESFVDKWLTLFDLDNKGVIAIDDYCERLGLVIDGEMQKLLRKKRASVLKLEGLDDFDDFVDVNDELDQHLIHVSITKPIATPTKSNASYNFREKNKIQDSPTKIKKSPHESPVKDASEEATKKPGFSFIGLFKNKIKSFKKPLSKESKEPETKEIKQNKKVTKSTSSLSRFLKRNTNKDDVVIVEEDPNQNKSFTKRSNTYDPKTSRPEFKRAVKSEGSESKSEKQIETKYFAKLAENNEMQKSNEKHKKKDEKSSKSFLEKRKTDKNTNVVKSEKTKPKQETGKGLSQNKVLTINSSDNKKNVVEVTVNDTKLNSPNENKEFFNHHQDVSSAQTDGNRLNYQKTVKTTDDHSNEKSSMSDKNNKTGGVKNDANRFSDSHAEGFKENNISKNLKNKITKDLSQSLDYVHHKTKLNDLTTEHLGNGQVLHSNLNKDNNIFSIRVDDKLKDSDKLKNVTYIDRDSLVNDLVKFEPSIRDLNQSGLRDQCEVLENIIIPAHSKNLASSKNNVSLMDKSVCIEDVIIPVHASEVNDSMNGNLKGYLNNQKSEDFHSESILHHSIDNDNIRINKVSDTCTPTENKNNELNNRKENEESIKKMNIADGKLINNKSIKINQNNNEKVIILVKDTDLSQSQPEIIEEERIGISDVKNESLINKGEEKDIPKIIEMRDRRTLLNKSGDDLSQNLTQNYDQILEKSEKNNISTIEVCGENSIINMEHQPKKNVINDNDIKDLTDFQSINKNEENYIKDVLNAEKLKNEFERLLSNEKGQTDSEKCLGSTKHHDTILDKDYKMEKNIDISRNLDKYKINIKLNNRNNSLFDDDIKYSNSQFIDDFKVSNENVFPKDRIQGFENQGVLKNFHNVDNRFQNEENLSNSIESQNINKLLAYPNPKDKKYYTTKSKETNEDLENVDIEKKVNDLNKNKFSPIDIDEQSHKKENIISRDLHNIKENESNIGKNYGNIMREKQPQSLENSSLKVQKDKRNDSGNVKYLGKSKENITEIDLINKLEKHPNVPENIKCNDENLDGIKFNVFDKKKRDLEILVDKSNINILGEIESADKISENIFQMDKNAELINRKVKIIEKDIDDEILPYILNRIVDIYERRMTNVDLEKKIKYMLEKYHDLYWHVLLCQDEYELYFSYENMLIFEYDYLTFIIWKTPEVML